MRKMIISLSLLLVGVMTSFGGPIIGLVDRSTGAEVPDADARYVKGSASNLVVSSLTVSNDVVILGSLTVNSNMTVSGRSAFTNAAIGIGTTNVSQGKVTIQGESGVYTNLPLLVINRTTNATGKIASFRTNGVEVASVDMNGRYTGDGSLLTGVFLLETHTLTNVSHTMVFNNQHTTNMGIQVAYPDAKIANGLLYATATNIYSKTVTLTFYKNSDYKGSNAYWRANMALVSVPLSGASAIGATSVAVLDSTGIAANDLVFFTQSNEFARVSSVVGNTLNFEDALLFGHSTTSNVSRVGEFRSFTVMDYSGTHTAWHRIDATNSTQTLKMVIEYVR